MPLMINPLFNDSKTHKRLRERADIRVAARKELDRITSASLTSLKSNFDTPEHLEETIRKLEKQITTQRNNKARLAGAMKRVTNMRTPLTRGGGFRRAALVAMATTKNNNGLVSHPLEPGAGNKQLTRGFGSVKKREKTPPANVNFGSFFEIAEAEKIAKNKKNERKKYEKMIKNGETISKPNRNTIELLYNNLAKELNKRNAANKAAASKAASNKEAAEKAKTITASAIASAIKKNKNIAKRMELEKVLTRLEKLNAPSAIKLYNTISNNNKRILNNNENLSNRYKSIKQQINNAKTGSKMGAFVQELSTQPPLKQKKLGIFNRGKAFFAARANKKAAAKPPPPSFNEAAARNALKRYLTNTVKPKYNKALVNAILRLPKENLNNNTRRRLQAPRMYALQRGAGAFRNRAVMAGGALGRGAVTAGGALGRGAGSLGRGAVTAGGALGRGAGSLGRGAVMAGGALGRGASGVGGFFSSFFARKPAGPPSFIPSNEAGEIPLGYVFKKNKQGLGYYKNNKAIASQVGTRGYGPAPKPVSSTTTGVSVGVGPGPRNRYGYGYGNNYGYGYGNRNRRGGGAGGGIVFKPQITVGAARIGAQTFGGTRVGGQQMGGSRVRTGNTGSTTLKTGNTGGTSVKTGNTGGARATTGNAGTTSNASRLAVSAPTTNGNRQLAATSEQLIRGAGGAEAVEQGIKALKAANGNVTRAKAASRLPNNTFTNIYAMGGPNAAKRIVESRRRRRVVGGRRVASKKRVARKPKKYIKLTPYQFRRLTDHIKKNNLRKVLIKEITH